jgi:hypothetical protein
VNVPDLKESGFLAALIDCGEAWDDRSGVAWRIGLPPSEWGEWFDLHDRTGFWTHAVAAMLRLFGAAGIWRLVNDVCAIAPSRWELGYARARLASRTRDALSDLNAQAKYYGVPVSPDFYRYPDPDRTASRPPPEPPAGFDARLSPERLFNLLKVEVRDGGDTFRFDLNGVPVESRIAEVAQHVIQEHRSVRHLPPSPVLPSFRVLHNGSLLSIGSRLIECGIRECDTLQIILQPAAPILRQDEQAGEPLLPTVEIIGENRMRKREIEMRLAYYSLADYLSGIFPGAEAALNHVELAYTPYVETAAGGRIRVPLFYSYPQSIVAYAFGRWLNGDERDRGRWVLFLFHCLTNYQTSTEFIDAIRPLTDCLSLAAAQEVRIRLSAHRSSVAALHRGIEIIEPLARVGLLKSFRSGMSDADRSRFVHEASIQVAGRDSVIMHHVINRLMSGGFVLGSPKADAL